MKKHLTTLNGQRLMFVGAALFGLCIVLGIVVNWSLSRKIPDCLNSSAACSIGWEQMGANASTALGFLGAGLFVIGLAILIAARLVTAKTQ